MSSYNKSRYCTSFKSVEHDVFSKSNSKNSLPNCKECIYFSSRNCAMDAAMSIDPILDIFC